MLVNRSAASEAEEAVSYMLQARLHSILVRILDDDSSERAHWHISSLSGL